VFRDLMNILLRSTAFNRDLWSRTNCTTHLCVFLCAALRYAGGSTQRRIQERLWRSCRAAPGTKPPPLSQVWFNTCRL